MSRVIWNARFMLQARGYRAAMRYAWGILKMLGPLEIVRGAMPRLSG